MANVYILVQGKDFEGYRIISCFQTLDKACEAAHELMTELDGNWLPEDQGEEGSRYRWDNGIEIIAVEIYKVIV